MSVPYELKEILHEMRDAIAANAEHLTKAVELVKLQRQLIENLEKRLSVLEDDKTLRELREIPHGSRN